MAGIVIDGKRYEKFSDNRVNIRTATPKGNIGDGGVIRQFNSGEEADAFIKSAQMMADAKNKANGERPESEKKEIVRKASTTAAGWAIFTSFVPAAPVLTSLYYGLRSDKTVAKEYGLDQVKDAKLIKNIKSKQSLWSLTAVIPGFGILPSVVGYLYNKNMNADNINLN